jgi:hypothetical protein
VTPTFNVSCTPLNIWNKFKKLSSQYFIAKKVCFDCFQVYLTFKCMLLQLGLFTILGKTNNKKIKDVLSSQFHPYYIKYLNFLFLLSVNAIKQPTKQHIYSSRHNLTLKVQSKFSSHALQHEIKIMFHCTVFPCYLLLKSFSRSWYQNPRMSRTIKSQNNLVSFVDVDFQSFLVLDNFEKLRI